jgi:hypothetical protein
MSPAVKQYKAKFFIIRQKLEVHRILKLDWKTDCGFKWLKGGDRIMFFLFQIYCGLPDFSNTNNCQIRDSACILPPSLLSTKISWKPIMILLTVLHSGSRKLLSKEGSLNWISAPVITRFREMNWKETFVVMQLNSWFLIRINFRALFNRINLLWDIEFWNSAGGTSTICWEFVIWIRFLQSILNP